LHLVSFVTVLRARTLTTWDVDRGTCNMSSIPVCVSTGFVTFVASSVLVPEEAGQWLFEILRQRRVGVSYARCIGTTGTTAFAWHVAIHCGWVC
jgi:hypothetical protein